QAERHRLDKCIRLAVLDEVRTSKVLPKLPDPF
ncbi:MAG: hypothetical protein ACI87A_003809, partial [Planctomycetota bacterium]